MTKPLRNPKYLKYIRTLDCYNCNRPGPNQAAHVRIGGDGGMGMKPSDYRAVPLCVACHGLQHSRGERTFWDALTKSGGTPGGAILYCLAKYCAIVYKDDAEGLINAIIGALEERRKR